MPRTGGYRRLISLLGDSAGGGTVAGVAVGTVGQIADATLGASLEGLKRAKRDETLAYCFFLLVRITRAARDVKFIEALADTGVLTPAQISGLPDAPIFHSTEEYGLFDLTSGFVAAIDDRVRATRTRTDIGELANLAAAESLSALCAPRTDSLFGNTGRGGVQLSLRSLSTRNGFARLAHDFFARLIRRYLEYHLSRELANHVGPGRRFRHVDDHNDFLQQLDDHCRVATSVMRKFAGDWYIKHNFKGDLSVPKAKDFASYAIDKVRGALAYQEGRKGNGEPDGHE
jgi:hypothetical protein